MSFAPPPPTKRNTDAKSAPAKKRTPSIASSSSSRRSSVGSEDAPDPSTSSGGYTVLTKPQIEPQPQPRTQPQPTSDSLQVAAQVYPWLYMNSTLDACFKTAESNAEKDLAEKSAELSAEESTLADERARFDAERQIDFADALSKGDLAESAPSIMQSFLAHGDECATVEGEALALATAPPSIAEEDELSPMRPYNAMLDRVESLQKECSRLRGAVVALTQGPGDADEEAKSARSQILQLFSSCLPTLQARADNLDMAHQLLEGAKQSLAMSLHLESMGYSDDEPDE
ncbi:hypothetical protein HMN09_01152600 [Mycena chlorophos]|uniref:Uncharacterized protein n=1 Tax=Mycena chlorophos TaxID=658473 RepID=A0A8H6VUB5_MYCCL|nr:hypothetical protein HMN09_01152600 [Mycena chlorophos]